MSEKLITIGHIAEDIAKPDNIIGGGVSYSGITAKALGYDVHVITKVPAGHRFIETLTERGISVLSLPTQIEGMTTFMNSYDASGHRKQILSGRQESITSGDLFSLEDSALDAGCILVAPVIGEVETGVIPQLAKHGLVAVTPQGYFRESGDDGVIYQKEWEGFEDDLSHATITVLSDEDIAIGGVVNEGLLYRITESSPIVVLTHGENGATIYQGGKKDFSVSAFPLMSEQTKDFTGAGDTFAAAYVTRFIRTNDHHEAAVFATLIAGIKIAGTSGTGVDSIPNQQQIEQFMQEHSLQMKEFLAKNQAQESFVTF